MEKAITKEIIITKFSIKKNFETIPKIKLQIKPMLINRHKWLTSPSNKSFLRTRFNIFLTSSINALLSYFFLNGLINFEDKTSKIPVTTILKIILKIQILSKIVLLPTLITTLITSLTIFMPN